MAVKCYKVMLGRVFILRAFRVALIIIIIIKNRLVAIGGYL